MEEILVIKQRDILLVPFPFSDLSGRKVRPVIVVSKDKFNESSYDIIVCAITSNLTKNNYSLKIDSSDLESGKLFKGCCIKAESIFKIDKKRVIKTIGCLKKEKFSNVLEKIDSLFK